MTKLVLLRKKVRRVLDSLPRISSQTILDLVTRPRKIEWNTIYLALVLSSNIKSNKSTKLKADAYTAA